MGFEWDFKCLNLEDYSLLITLPASVGIFKKVVYETLKKAKAETPDIDFRKIPYFNVQTRYYPLVKLAIKKCFGEVTKEVVKDGITLYDYHIKKVSIYNRNTRYDIEITCGGLYAQKE